MTHFCEGCAHNGDPSVAATHFYRWKDGTGHTSPCCKRHYEDWTASERILFMSQKADAEGGPYAGETGSKGGGASADLAKIWNGKGGDFRRRVLLYVDDNGAHGADDIAAGLGEHFLDIRPRCSELTKEAFGGLLERVQIEGVRTSRNAKAWAYALTETGRVEARRLRKEARAA